MKRIFYFLWPILALILSYYILFVFPPPISMFGQWNVGAIILMFIGMFATATFALPFYFLALPEMILQFFSEYPLHACIVYSLLILSYTWWFKQPRWLSGIAVLLISAFTGPAMITTFAILGLDATPFFDLIHLP